MRRLSLSRSPRNSLKYFEKTIQWRQSSRKCRFFSLRLVFEALYRFSLQKDIKNLVHDNSCFLIFNLKFTPCLELLKQTNFLSIHNINHVLKIALSDLLIIAMPLDQHVKNKYLLIWLTCEKISTDCYRIYRKYWDTLMPYHTGPKTWTSLFYYIFYMLG